MKIYKLDIESEILGKEVWQLEDLCDGKEFVNDELSIISKYSPFYLQCQVDTGDLFLIHSLEDAGFRFVEFRLRKLLDIHTFQSIGDLAYYPYFLKRIGEEEIFKKAQDIVTESSSDDRFSRDPIITKDMAQHRLQGYLQKSFDNVENETVYGLFNKNTTELLAIKTVEQIAQNEIVFCHTALKEELDVKKFTYMLDSLLISQLLEEGITYFYSITSGLNLMEMDLHISELKYKNMSSAVILRKVYN